MDCLAHFVPNPPILCPIHPTPLSSGLRLVRGRLGWRNREREEEGETKEEEEIKQRQEEEEKKNLDLNYYPPSPRYVPNYEEGPPALVGDLIPKLALEKCRVMKQSKEENTMEEDRRIVLELLDEERDLDHYSELDSDSD